MKPAVGTAVEIEVDTSFVHRYLVGEAKHIVPPVSKIVGIVDAGVSWFPEHIAVFSSATGRVSYVAIRTIKSINNQQFNQPRVEQKDQQWTVSSSKGKGSYTVTYSAATKHFNCSCSGFAFRRNCRHVLDAKQQLEAA